MKNIFKTIAVIAICLLTFVGLVGCGPDTIEKVEQKVTLATPTNIKYSPETGKVTWDGVKNAGFYMVTFNGGPETKVVTTSVSYKTDDDSFTFTIKADSDGLYLASNVASVTFAKLDSDIEISVDEDGKITWNEVTIATGYEVEVDGKVTTVPSPVYDDLVPGAAHSIRVRPVKEDVQNTYFYSSWSEKKTITLLGQVDKKSIRYDNGAIKWNPINGVSSYSVTINDVTYEATTTQLTYDPNNANFNVTVQALGNHTTTFDGKKSDLKQFVFLDVVSNITVENGALTWTPVENASSYQIKLKSNSNTPVVSQTNVYDRLAAGEQYNVSVLPIGQDSDVSYFSNWSVSTSILILKAPDIKWVAGLDADGQDVANAIHWDVVNQATGYHYHMTKPNGEEAEGTLGAINNYFGDTFAETGAYEIKVKATADGQEGVFDSAYSTPIVVKRLAAPTIGNDNIVSTPNSLKAGFRVSFSGISDATSYRLYRDQTAVQTVTTPQFNVTDLFEEGKIREDQYAYYVQSLGSVSADGKKVVLSSLMGEASQSSSFIITILQTPQSPTITGKDYGAEYSYIGVANGYGYNISVSGTNYDSSSTTYSLNALEVGTYEVKVCAKGNGHNVLASDFSTPITVTRINAPYNLKIDTGESDGQLSFDGAMKALSYQVLITGREEALTVSETTNMREYITTQGTILHMYSIANYFDDDQQTLFYMTSPASTNYTFVKLETPNNINFSNTNMTWNAPSNLNVTGSAFTPTYKIIDGATLQLYNGEFAGLSYPLDTFEAGTYSFNIIAVGDGERFINSDPAVSREIKKLAVPEFSVNVGQAQYEWFPVIGATSYALVIDSVVVDTSEENYNGSVYSYKPRYTALGTHTVELYAVGDGGKTTINSKSFTYNQTVAQLQTPAFMYSYDHEYYDVEGKINMTITTESPNATGYVYNIGNADHLSTETSFDFNPNTSGDLGLYVYAKGGGFDAQEVYYLDSRSTSTQNITLLGYPTESSIEVSMQGQLKWSKIDKAAGYIVKLSFTDTEGNSYEATLTLDQNTAQVVLSNFKATNTSTQAETTITYNQIRKLTVTIQAKGNMVANVLVAGNKLVTSAPVTHIFPSDLH